MNHDTVETAARNAYAHAAAICRERAAAHRLTKEKSQTADLTQLDHAAHEAEKCALAIEAAIRDVGRKTEPPPRPPEPEILKLDESPNPDNLSLRVRSGEVNIDSRLVGFLYDLLRDHLPAGTVEKLVRECKIPEIYYTNGWLARYAADLAARLEGRVT